MNQRKPIAVLSKDLNDGLRFVDDLLDFRELDYARQGNQIRDVTGQMYYIISHPNELLGIEISRVMKTKHCYVNSNYREMDELANTRIRVDVDGE